MNKQNNPQPFEKYWRKKFEYFARCAEDDAGIAGWSKTGLETRLRQFIQRWEASTPDKGLWLDAGCGAGSYSRFLAQQGSDVIGIDYSILSLKKARLRGENTIAWCMADVNNLPVKQGCFDGVICFGVTQALRDSAIVTRELSNVVKPGGQVWIDALNQQCLPNRWEQFKRHILKRPMHLRYESPHNMRQLMKNNGLTNIQLYWLPILPSRWVRFQWLMETHFARWCFRFLPLFGPLLCHAFILYGEQPHND